MPIEVTQPKIIPVILHDGSEGYRLCETYVYTWEAEGAIWRIVIPEGFEYDGASVPRLLWSIVGVSRDGLHRAAALVHDWIYRHGGILPDASFWKDNHSIECFPWRRHQADKLFANILALSGVSRLKRRLMYLGVRAGGWIAWRGAQLHDHESY